MQETNLQTKYIHIYHATPVNIQHTFEILLHLFGLIVAS